MFLVRELIDITKESSASVNLCSYKANPDNSNRLACFTVNHLWFVKLEPMIDPVPDCSSDAIILPAVHSFIESKLRRNTLETVHKSIDTSLALADQLKKVGND